MREQDSFRRHAMLARSLYVLLSVSALGACEDTTKVGSTCPNGVCPLALTRSDDACLVSAAEMKIAIIGEVEQAPFELRLCLPQPYARASDGTIDARLVFALPASGDVQCTDRGFLRPLGDDLRARYADSATEHFCEVNQVSVTTSDGGEANVAAGEGFYYDDFSEVALTHCFDPHALRFTPAARPWDGVTVIVSVIQKAASDGQTNDALVCEALPGSAPVGTSCLPAQTIYHAMQTVLETRSDACGGGVCMAYRLEGDVRASCDPSTRPDSGQLEPRCADEADIERRAYCTCRCDAAKGSPDACNCPDDFTCVRAMRGAGKELDGSYCVKNGTFFTE